MRKPTTSLSEQDALKRMAAFCSQSEHCRSEIEEKLQRLELPDEAIERILQRLEEEQFIDEARYCRAFVNDKLRFSGWGKRKMAQALQQKHISRLVYQPAIDAIDPQAYKAALRKALEQKERSMKPEIAGYQRKVKLLHYGESRGYSFEELRQFIDLSSTEEPGFEEDL
ncbi:MAG: RecX family transcriptional regulator [Bacteroidaceae bacterium]|nr:RecX family transcriptional regulator [Bacteroidaceae bacterium]